MRGRPPHGECEWCRRTTQEDTMHPEIIRALMDERVREAQATELRRYRGTRQPRRLFRCPRPRTAWTTWTVCPAMPGMLGCGRAQEVSPAFVGRKAELSTLAELR